MIVKCEQCQTKFKIPDDKVTDKGVKVRCTKCNHTFRVTREQGQPEPPTQKVATPKPPLDSADPFAKFGTSTQLPNEEATRPGVFALGVEASRMPDFGRPVPAPNPVEAPKPAGASPFDFGSLTPPSPNKPAAAPAPFDFSNLMGPPSPSAAAPPNKPNAPAAPRAGPAPFDFSALTAPAPEPEPAKPLPAPRTSAPPRPVDAPAMSFDFSSLGPPPSSAVTQPNQVLPSQPVTATQPTFTPTNTTLPETPAVSNLLGDLPPPPTREQVPPPLGDDFFGAGPTNAAGARLASVPDGASKEEARSTLFDMSATGKDEAPAPIAPVPAPALESAAVPMASTPSSIINVPKPPDPATERGRRVLGIVVNVLIAAVLVVGLVVVGTATVNEGKLDLQSIETSLRALIAPASPFTADDISNGLYETRMGRPVFFVRGVVTNRSPGAARVRVKAEILDGATLVRSAEVVAGAPPTPEELYQLAEVADLKALMDRTSSKAKPIEAGGSVPFLVTFSEYPPDLKAFRVRVTASAEGQPTAAATP